MRYVHDTLDDLEIGSGRTSAGSNMTFLMGTALSCTSSAHSFLTRKGFLKV